VFIFLETAELRAKNRIDISMKFWKENVDKILELNDREILKGAGAISHTQMEEQLTGLYEQFDAKRKAYEANIEDRKDLEDIEKQLKTRKDKKK
jgi:hypothetical protein